MQISIENQITLNVRNKNRHQDAVLDDFDRFIISDEGANSFAKDLEN